jgi:glycosyltransferase involved in cell wall biosynthesis
MALITTVLPTFRRPRWLVRALHSVLRQTERDFEVRVYDNASGDETEEVVRAIAARDARVKYYCHSVNLGPIENFRIAIAQVNTPYFNILSDDDLLFPRFFERTLRGLDCRPEAILCAGLLHHVNAKGQLLAIPLNGWREGLYSAPQAAFRWARKGDTWTSIMFRKEIIEITGGIDPCAGLEADFDFLLRGLTAAPMILMKEHFAAFTIHEHSAMSGGSVEQLIAGMRRIENKASAMEHLSVTDREQLRRVVFAANASRLFRLTMKSALRGRRQEIRPAIHELRDRFRQPGRAAVLSIMTSPARVGALARSTIRSSYNLRRHLRALRFRTPHLKADDFVTTGDPLAGAK